MLSSSLYFIVMCSLGDGGTVVLLLFLKFLFITCCESSWTVLFLVFMKNGRKDATDAGTLVPSICGLLR